MFHSDEVKIVITFLITDLQSKEVGTGVLKIAPCGSDIESVSFIRDDLKITSKRNCFLPDS